MEWIALAKLGIVALLIAAQVPAMRRQWAEDRDGVIKAVRIIAYYLIYCGVGIAIVITTVAYSADPARAFLVSIAFFLGWLMLGVSWLLKVSPSKRPLPAWLLAPFSPLDAIALALIVVSLLVMLAL